MGHPSIGLTERGHKLYVRMIADHFKFSSHSTINRPKTTTKRQAAPNIRDKIRKGNVIVKIRLFPTVHCFAGFHVAIIYMQRIPFLDTLKCFAPNGENRIWLALIDIFHATRVSFTPVLTLICRTRQTMFCDPFTQSRLLCYAWFTLFHLPSNSSWSIKLSKHSLHIIRPRNLN